MPRCLFLLLLFTFFLRVELSAQTKQNKFLVSYEDTVTHSYGYKDASGNIIIPAGRYLMVFTDTLRNYALVADSANGIIGIDPQGKMLYHVFVFDNGPDEVRDGLFRIIENGKIGYADATTGKIVIKPQFDCAFAFAKGKARVSKSCETKQEGEYHMWTGDNWYYIDKKGKKTDPPKRYRAKEHE